MPRKEFEAFTRLDASDVNTLLMDQSVMSFAGTAARGSAIATPVEGMVTYLEDSNTIQAYNSTAWVTVANAGTAAYNFVETLYFTSDGTFTKATYPWLRAIRVKVQGAGGGGGGAATTGASTFAAGGGGGGGAYGEKFITNIAALDDSITVTRGAGGAGGAINGTGTAGGTSSFGTVVSATGGAGGTGGEGAQSAAAAFGSPGAPGLTSSGSDFLIPGSHGTTGFVRSVNRGFRGSGGASFLGASRGHVVAGASVTGDAGFLYGGGGGGAVNPVNSTTGSTGGAGANGIVIVEMYA